MYNSSQNQHEYSNIKINPFKGKSIKGQIVNGKLGVTQRNHIYKLISYYFNSN